MAIDVQSAAGDIAQARDEGALRADFRMLRVAIWSVVVYCGLGLVGFAVLAGFWPPPAEYLGAAEIAT
ncbi:hypothetical protein [Mycolicibacterium komossense]|uniref:DUF485 domain-containing protein n=1 Tax=Mycolicibacterium komossense TaxID=1779 RepID=A0ABT3CB52_9MYCO|nr:hypothetical protein [Mycolicibacterium komossense]MCV7226486.1 hypothetical protein [Mycolicibacterium komossense]